MRIETIDLEFQGSPHVIASFLVHGPEGPVLLEPGPGSTLATLQERLAERGIEPTDVKAVLVTHIHLDHAGSAGWWARQGVPVYVHPRGAPHLIDPSKLLASATRIYGDRMDTLWGEILPAPEERVNVVQDGDEIAAGGVGFHVVESVGHARHHHAYRVDDTLFAGDSAGILLPGNRWIDLPAPPPEFDHEAWKDTLERFRGLGLQTIYRTHFGPTSDVDRELDAFEAVLDRATGWVGELLRDGLDRDGMVKEFSARMRRWASDTGISDADILGYELANPRVMSIDGIARYWAKRG
jgi:glyoxylase-like metal-dependent hydrolase (beta-lactamase superfamily II)